MELGFVKKIAKSYRNTTGVLMLDAVTPVIEALFKSFDLDKSVPGNGEAYVASLVGSASKSWDLVIDRLANYAKSIVLEIPRIEGRVHGEQLLIALAKHFGVESDERLDNVLGQLSCEENAGIEELCQLAEILDDGHGLRGFKLETSVHCSKPWLFEFGGAGEYHGKHVSISVCSKYALNLGTALEAAIGSSDLDKAGQILAKKCMDLISSIRDQGTRTAVRTQVLALLEKESE